MLKKLVTSYFNACDITVANSNHNIFLHFFTWTCAPHFEKGSATHAVRCNQFDFVPQS